MTAKDVLLTADDVLQMTGFKSRTTLWRKVKKGELPAPIKVGASAIRWRACEILEWIDSRPRQYY